MSEIDPIKNHRSRNGVAKTLVRYFVQGILILAPIGITTYNFAGQLYVLPRERIRDIENLSAGEAMKYAVTGGIAETRVRGENESESTKES